MNNELMFSTGKDDWETPHDFFKKLDDEFHFTLDPCCTTKTAKCKKYYTVSENGLAQDWSGETVFCNPPYSKKSKNNPYYQDLWVKKAFEESKKPNTTVVMLIPARTDKKVFHKYIYHHAEIRFIEGRLKFVGAKDTAPFPSMVVIFRNN